MSDFTPEQVERAAKELWQNALRRGASHWKSWGAVDGYAKEEYLEFASAVLSAVGAPEKVAPVVEREKAAHKEGFEEGRKFSSSARENEIELAKLFDQHEKMLDQTAVYDGRCSCGHYEPRGDHSGHVAEVLLAYLRGESK